MTNLGYPCKSGSAHLSTLWEAFGLKGLQEWLQRDE